MLSYKRQTFPRVQAPLRMVWAAREGQCQGAKATSAGRVEMKGNSSELGASPEKSQEKGSRGCWTVEPYMSPHHSSSCLLSLSVSLSLSSSPTHSHHSCAADSREREVDVFCSNWSPQTVFLEQEEKTPPDSCHKFSPIFTCLFLCHAIPRALAYNRA